MIASDFNDERARERQERAREREETASMGEPGGEEGQAQGRIFSVSEGVTPRLLMSNLDGALRVRGNDASANQIAVRAVRANGEPVPLDLVAEVRVTIDGEVIVKALHHHEIQRQVRQITRAFDRGFRDSDLFDNLGEMIDSLAQMKTYGRNLNAVALEALVPPTCDLTLSTASGRILVEDAHGAIQVQSASGKVECSRLGGKLSVKTASSKIRIAAIEGSAYVQSSSGSVVADTVNGDLVVQTTSGSMEAIGVFGQLGYKSLSGSLDVRRSRLNGFYLNTTSAGCSVEATLGPGEYEVRTVSGEVRLYPQPDLNARLTGRTVSGSFRCALPYRFADEVGRAEADMQDDDGDQDEPGPFSGPEVRLGNLHISPEGVEMPGRFRIDAHTVDLPGVKINIADDDDRWDWRAEHDWGREQRRERRRGRNRWEYLIGDPEKAANGDVKLRVRTVSGGLRIRPGRDSIDDVPETGARRGAAPVSTAADSRGWPDAELWPSRSAATSGAAPAPPDPPAPPAPPTPPAPARAMEVTMNEEQQAATASTPDTATEIETAEERPVGEAARLAILEALERNEITAEEAMALLRQLDV